MYLILLVLKTANYELESQFVKLLYGFLQIECLQTTWNHFSKVSVSEGQITMNCLIKKQRSTSKYLPALMGLYSAPQVRYYQQSLFIFISKAFICSFPCGKADFHDDSLLNFNTLFTHHIDIRIFHKIMKSLQRK